MKQNFILLMFLLGMISVSFGQEVSERTFGPDSKKNDGTQELDSLGYNDVKSVIRTWKFEDLASEKKSISLDTILGELQNYNPIFKRSISNSYLGNLGSAYQSNIYMNRENESFLFFNTYRAYLLKPEDIVFFNTTTPYTRLFYETGGPKRQSENLLKVLHTQNISPLWNFGISYNLISSDGQYQNQKTKLYDLSLFSTYKKRRYGLAFVLNQNRIAVEENGGIFSDDLLEENDNESENIQVNLDESNSKLTNMNLFVRNSYSIGVEREVVTEEDTTYLYAIDLLLNTEFETNSWRFRETIQNKDFYKNNYYDANASFDKVEQSVVRNTFQIVFNENESKWIRLGARFGILSEFQKYNLRRTVTEYSWKQEDENIHNNQLIASFFSMSGSSLNWKATGKYVFEGYRQNDFDLNYELTKWIGGKESAHGFKLKGILSSQTPNFILNEYYGNHQQWNKNLEKRTELELGFEYFNQKHKLKMGGQINQIDRYTYFGLDTIPQQAGSGIAVATGYIEKKFKLGNFYLNQKLIGQKSSKEQILPLPDFSIYSNNYYKNSFFKGALDIQVGFAVYYNTAFYAPAYMPSIGQFFLQNQKELGDYPKVDLYFNFRIKRTRIFVMYEHANASLGSKNYFTSLHYPLNPAMLKYGLIWTFYN